MRMWLLSLAPHSLSPHGRGPPSPTTTTTAGTAARTAPLSSTQYVTNDCCCASISTADATDAFWFCCVLHHLHASPHAPQICGSSSAFLDVHPGTHGATRDIASTKDGAPSKSLEHVLNKTSREAQPTFSPFSLFPPSKKKSRHLHDDNFA